MKLIAKTVQNSYIIEVQDYELDKLKEGSITVSEKCICSFCGELQNHNENPAQIILYVKFPEYAIEENTQKCFNYSEFILCSNCYQNQKYMTLENYTEVVENNF